MALTPSTMLPLGTPAPGFRLQDPNGRSYTLEDFSGQPVLVVIFMCNHCPFVKHLREGLAKFALDYQNYPVAIVGINANNPETHPADSIDKMAIEAREAGYVFPYLFDATQQTAKDYHAACTPDFFVFDRQRKLAYRGQFDDSRPNNGQPVTGCDLRAAVDALLQNKPVSPDQKPSIGCNIKWRAGEEPAYYQATVKK